MWLYMCDWEKDGITNKAAYDILPDLLRQDGWPNGTCSAVLLIGKNKPPTQLIERLQRKCRICGFMKLESLSASFDLESSA